MLEEIQSWNFFSQLAVGGLLAVTVLYFVLSLALRNNKPVISEASELYAELDEKGADMLTMFIAEHEAHQINDSIDDKKEAQRLSNIDN